MRAVIEKSGEYPEQRGGPVLKRNSFEESYSVDKKGVGIQSRRNFYDIAGKSK